jgi:hypothetical protein
MLVRLVTDVAAGLQAPHADTEGFGEFAGCSGPVLARQGDRDQGRTAGVDEYLVASGEFDSAVVGHEWQAVGRQPKHLAGQEHRAQKIY